MYTMKHIFIVYIEYVKYIYQTNDGGIGHYSLWMPDLGEDKEASGGRDPSTFSLALFRHRRGGPPGHLGNSQTPNPVYMPYKMNCKDPHTGSYHHHKPLIAAIVDSLLHRAELGLTTVLHKIRGVYWHRPRGLGLVRPGLLAEDAGCPPHLLVVGAENSPP